MLAQAIGSQSLQVLQPARRDEYMRNVSSLEGLTSLAAAVSRTSTAMLSEVCFVMILKALLPALSSAQLMLHWMVTSSSADVAPFSGSQISWNLHGIQSDSSQL